MVSWVENETSERILMGVFVSWYGIFPVRQDIPDAAVQYDSENGPGGRRPIVHENYITSGHTCSNCMIRIRIRTAMIIDCMLATNEIIWGAIACR